MKGEGGYCSGTGVCDPKGVHKSQKLSGVIIVKEYFPINGFGPFRITRYNFTPMAFRPGTMQGIVFMNFPSSKAMLVLWGRKTGSSSLMRKDSFTHWSACRGEILREEMIS